MNKLKGKVAIVTGAAAGIGEASVKLFAAEGARVVVADINESDAQRVAEEIRAAGGEATAIRADVGKLEEVRALVDKTVGTYGGVDVLFNNAYAKHLLTLDLSVVDIDPQVWDDIMRINVTGPMLACKYAIPHMIKRGGGSIINTSSLAHRASEDVRCAYSSSKAALNALGRSVAVQYGKQGIRCNTIAPGLVVTPTVLSVIPEKEREIYLAHAMTPTLGEPKNIATVALFLACDDSAYVTGQVIEADGGLGIYAATVPSQRKGWWR